MLNFCKKVVEMQENQFFFLEDIGKPLGTRHKTGLQISALHHEFKTMSRGCTAHTLCSRAACTSKFLVKYK